MRHPFVLVLALVVSSVARAETPRPPQHGHSPLATDVTTASTNGAFPGKAYYDALPADQRRQLDKQGQVLLGDDKSTDSSMSGYIRAVAIFKQPKQRVFEMMAQPEMQALYLPHVESSTPASKVQNGELTDFDLKFLLSHVRIHVWHWFYPEQSRIEWWLDKSQKNDIKSQEGYWQLFALTPTTTIGEYGTRIETGIAVPKWLADVFARNDIPGALIAFRRYMDSNGTWRK